MQKLKTGGKSPLHIFLKGNDDLRDSLLPNANGDRKTRRGFSQLVEEKYGGAFKVELSHEPCDGDFIVADHVDSRLWSDQPDIVVLSLEPFLQPRSSTVEIEVEEFKAGFMRLIKRLKERLDAHVIAYNCSSVDPEDHCYNYRGIAGTLALRVQRFNLALMEISIREGISIVDVDRIIAHLGGENHVTFALSYSTEAHQAIAREFLRILEEIGFFENRPLVMQIGRQEN